MSALPRASRTAARRTARCSALLAASTLVVLSTAGLASAHVHVDGEDATQGGYGVLTFRVPTESDTASTNQVKVSFPKDTPIASVSTQPVPGWTAKVTTAKLATPITTDDGSLDTYVSLVTWTADDAAAAIHPGEFQQFSVSAGPLPDADSVTFPTIQGYDDGTSVAWTEVAADGAAEPEHPAPVLELAPADDAAATGSPSAEPSVSATATSTDEAAGETSDSDGSSSAPGWIGLAAGVVALLVAAAAFARGGRKS